MIGLGCEENKTGTAVAVCERSPKSVNYMDSEGGIYGVDHMTWSMRFALSTHGHVSIKFNHSSQLNMWFLLMIIMCFLKIPTWSFAKNQYSQVEVLISGGHVIASDAEPDITVHSEQLTADLKKEQAFLSLLS